MREFLSLDLVLKAEANSDGVSVVGNYNHAEGVLNADYALRVAAKLDKVREGSFSGSLNGVYGEFWKSFFKDLIFKQ